MTRHKLKGQKGQRKRFRGTFVRFGKKPAYRGPDKTTILLKDVADLETGAKVADHLWFNLTKGFEALGLISGDLVEFDARVKAYTKGYRGRRDDVNRPVQTDYKLSHPTRCKLVEPGEQRKRQHWLATGKEWTN